MLTFNSLIDNPLMKIKYNSTPTKSANMSFIVFASPTT